MPYDNITTLLKEENKDFHFGKFNNEIDRVFVKREKEYKEEQQKEYDDETLEPSSVSKWCCLPSPRSCSVGSSQTGAGMNSDTTASRRGARLTGLAAQGFPRRPERVERKREAAR